MSCFHHQFLPLLYGQTRTLIAFGKNIFRSQYNKGFLFWKPPSHKWSFFVYTQPVLGVFNLMTPLGRLKVLFSTIVLLFWEHGAKNMSEGPKNLFRGLLTDWAHRAGCGSHATTVLFFWGHVSCFSCVVLLAKQASLILWLSKAAFSSNH